MAPSPGYNPATTDFLSGNWTTSDPRKIAANQQKINAQSAQASQQNANATQGFLDPIEQNLASGQGGYTPDEAAQIRMTPQQQADIVNRAGTTAGAATAAGVDAATRASNAAGGNPAAVAAYRARAAQQEGSQAADAMTGARVGASNAAAQREENIGQTRIGQQNVGLGLQQGYQQEQNANQEKAQDRQTQGSQLGVQASQTPSTFDKIMGGVAGALPSALSFLDEGGSGGNAVVAEDGPEAVVKLEPKMNPAQRQQYGAETQGHLTRARSMLQGAEPGGEANRVHAFLEQASASKGDDPVQAIQLARKAATLSHELAPADPVLGKLRGMNTPPPPPAEAYRRSYHEDGGSGEGEGPEGMDVPHGTTQIGDDSATQQPWYKRFMSSITPQPPNAQAPGAPAQMNGAGPTPPSMQSAQTLGKAIGGTAKGIASMFMEDGWTGKEPGTWGGGSDGSIDSVSKFLADGAPMEAADGAIFTKPTEIKMAPGEAAVPLGYRARAKTRPSMALPLVDKIQQRRMYGAA